MFVDHHPASPGAPNHPVGVTWLPSPSDHRTVGRVLENARMSTRGLVLGGGGITGIAWETGLLTGLAEAGVDLTTADRVI
eukprot:gene10869-13802_t